MLEIKHLHKQFQHAKGFLKAVDDVSFSIGEKQIVGLVGESGSGKSTLGKMLVGLLTPDSGDIVWNGKPFPKQFSRNDYLLNNKEIQMIFQDPYSSLNPRMQVSQILEEPLLLNKHQDYLKKSAQAKRLFLQEQLERVGLRSEFLTRFPHEFSGGQLQRIGIARALIQKPRLLICDEPISALDVSIQAQIVNLLKSLQEDNQLSLLFIAHDLAMVNYVCDEVVVMHKGKIVEQGSREQIFFHAQHPYTQALLAANPVLPTSV